MNTRELEEARAQVLELYQELARRNLDLQDLVKRLVQGQEHGDGRRPVTRPEQPAGWYVIEDDAGGNVETREFIALAEQITRQELDPFFTEWLFTPAKPASLGDTAAARTAPLSAAPVRSRKGVRR